MVRVGSGIDNGKLVIRCNDATAGMPDVAGPSGSEERQCLDCQPNFSAARWYYELNSAVWVVSPYLCRANQEHRRSEG
ncbi:MAG: hypothetical protein ACLRS8_15975 [Parabacteroides merdae]